MKKGFKSLFSFALMLLIATLMIFSVSASGTRGLSWYIHKASGSSVPQVMPEASGFFSKYSAIFVGDSTKKTVYLTFDAGYDNGNMVLILDALKQAGVKAAFFLEQQPQIAFADRKALRHHTSRHTGIEKVAINKPLYDNVARSLGATFFGLLPLIARGA